MIGKVFVARPIFEETLELLKQETELVVNLEDRILPKPELIEKLRNVDGVFTFTTDMVDREVIAAAPQLKVIANFGVGYNNVDSTAATELGVILTNTPGVLTETTADLAWALLMAAARRTAEGDRLVRAGKFTMWGPRMLLGHDVFGKTLGLIGFGRIGQAVARRARGFDMRVLFHDHKTIPPATLPAGVEQVSLDELYRQSDFISLHVPLSDETRHLLNDRTFAMMKPSCLVINSSRGPVVDEKALVRALQGGTIGGAALDVYEHEPQIEPELLIMENVVLLPHIGSGSHETRLKMAMMAAENLLAALKGKRPPNLVNPAVWDRRRS